MKKILLIISLLLLNFVHLEANIDDRINSITAQIDSINTEKIIPINKIQSVSSNINNTVAILEAKNKSDESIRKHKIYLVIILAVTALLLLWMTLKYLKVNNNSNENMSKLGGIIVILFMLGFVVIIIQDTEQMASVIGLLGAIAGYFLKEGQNILASDSEKINEKNED